MRGYKDVCTFLLRMSCDIFNLQDPRICGTGHYLSQVLRWNAWCILLAMHQDRVPREIENNQ